MPNVLNLLPNAVGQSAPTQVYGEVSTTYPAPQSFSDPLFVVIPDWNPTQIFTVTNWPALYGTALPQPGVECFIEYDNQSNLRVTWWNGDFGLDLSGAGVLMADNNLSDVASASAALSNLGLSSPVPWKSIPLASGWTAYGSGWPSPRYMIDSEGFVVLGGLAACSSQALFNVTLGTLPETPAYYHQVIAMAGTNTSVGPGVVQVTPGGVLSVFSCGATVTDFQLDGVRFPLN